jgi:splicing factor 3A subunit 3
LQNTPLEQLDRKHFAKILRTPNVLSESSIDNSFKDDLKKETALLEVKMKRLCELLDEVSSLPAPGLYIHVTVGTWHIC